MSKAKELLNESKSILEANFIKTEKVKNGDLNFSITVPVKGKYQISKHLYDNDKVSTALDIEYDYKAMEAEVKKALVVELKKLIPSEIKTDVFANQGGTNSIGFGNTFKDQYIF